MCPYCKADGAEFDEYENIYVCGDNHCNAKFNYGGDRIWDKIEVVEKKNCGKCIDNLK